MRGMNIAAVTARRLRASFFQRPCRNITISSRYPLPSHSPLTVSRLASTYSSKTSEANTEPVKPNVKPKAATQLRRSASASLPIRANPTPTRSQIQPVSILTTAERYFVPRLRPELPQGSIKLHESWWIPRWKANGKEGEVFMFENGSLVCWGLDENDARTFAKQYINRAVVEVAHLAEPETEDVEFVTDPNEKTRLQGDLIILGHSPPPEDETSLPKNVPDMVYPAETLLARYSFSQALARSSALSALETALDTYLSSVSVLPYTLSSTGKPGLGRRELIMKLGELMKFRQGLNLSRESFLDTPDFYWAEPVLEGYFKSMTDALDMRSRIRSVNDKITYAAEMQSMLRELLAESSGHRMELIIIMLIAVEVVICLIRDGPELWHMLTDRESEESSKSKASQ